MNFRTKVIELAQLPSWRAEMRASGRRLVVTNGCFDLLHIGHATYLEAARNCGDALLVGVNGDEAVRQLKGPTRPINSERDRAAVIAALEAVSAASIFPEVRATAFLSLVQPDIYVKGGDYTVETLDPDERRAVESCGARIVIIPMVPGKSTTATLQRVVAG